MQAFSGVLKTCLSLALKFSREDENPILKAVENWSTSRIGKEHARKLLDLFNQVLASGSVHSYV
jgi:hypothetical protein